MTALVIQQPNFFGRLEDVDALTDWAHAHGALVIAVVNPMALALLKPPGQWGARGADIAVGEGQPLGVPLSSGGPYLGFMTARMEHVRQMPGRIVGRTLDVAGKSGFTLTLQAREQHIRRAKATSNICTNQGLLMTAATIYLSLMGPQGLTRTAAACHARTRELLAALTRVPGVRLAFAGPCFHEAVLLLDRPVAPLLKALGARGIAAGLDLAPYYPELGPALLVCATETKTQADIERYRASLKRSDAGGARRLKRNTIRGSQRTGDFRVFHSRTRGERPVAGGRGRASRSRTCPRHCAAPRRRRCRKSASSRRCATSRASRS